MRRKFLILLFPMVFSGVVFGSTPIDWQTAVDRVLNHCCLLQIAEDHYDIAQALKEQSQVWPNPELSIAYEGYPHEPCNEDNEVDIEVEQLIELGGKRSARFRIADAEVNIAGWGVEAAKIHLLNELAHAVIYAASVQAKAGLAEEKLNIAKEIFEGMQAKAESGMATQTQVKRSRLELATSEIELKKQRKNLEQAYRGIAFQWHSSELDFDEVDYPFDELSPLRTLEDYFSKL